VECGGYQVRLQHAFSASRLFGTGFSDRLATTRYLTAGSPLRDR